MSRFITISFLALAIILLGRAGRIHWRVWKAAESRQDLLAHFVDHTKTLTERELDEARFWSRYGAYPSKTFAWYLMGGLCAAGVADWLDRRTRRAKNEERVRDA